MQYIQHVVELHVFHWDNDQFTSEFKTYPFSTPDDAGEFYYEMVMNRSFNEDMYGDKYYGVHHHDDSRLSRRLGIHHGGVYKYGHGIYRITKEEITDEWRNSSGR